MRFKADWDEAKARLTALWRGTPLDRPCIAVTAPSGREVAWPPAPVSHAQQWVDPDWVVRQALASMESTWWGGEAVPSYLLMAGWIVNFGGRPVFDAATIWFETETFDFDRPPCFCFDPADAWVRRFDACHAALARAAGQDDFMVGQPVMLPACDVLSMRMGTEQFLLALHDHPDWMRQALAQGAQAQAAGMEYFRGRLAGRHDFPYGIAGWMPFWAPEPFVATQSDVSCMLSPALYGEFVFPELQLYAEHCGPVWYHLDGRDAQQHLPRLLAWERLRVLQYTPTPGEPPNGPAHLRFYRQVQAAGKILHLDVPGEHVAALLRELDPGRLMLYTHCASRADGERLLAEAGRWARNR